MHSFAEFGVLVFSLGEKHAEDLHRIELIRSEPQVRMDPMIGERIREARLARNQSLADVAGKANISVATLSRIENDKQSVELNMFLQLARVLEITPTELLQDASETTEDGSRLDPLVRRISSLASRERLELWRELATERRNQRVKPRTATARHVAQQVEELLAQIDFLREELESVRKRMKRR
jgi:transcriptional regulator with XRE-family HTH domain